MTNDEESVDRALKDAAKAWARIQKRGNQNYTDWMTVVGPAFMAASNLAMRKAGTNQRKGRGYNEAFSKLLWKHGLHDDQDSGIDRTSRAALFNIMENAKEVDEWRAKEPGAYNLNSPDRIWQGFQKSDAYRAIQIARGELPLGEEDGTPRPQRAPVREKPTLLEENVALRDRVRDLEGRIEDAEQERDQAREDRPSALEPLVERLVEICLTHHHSIDDLITWIGRAANRQRQVPEPESPPVSESEAPAEPEPATEIPAAAQWTPTGDRDIEEMTGTHCQYQVLNDGHGYAIHFKLPNKARWKTTGYHYRTAFTAKQAAEEHDRTFKPPRRR
jgi:hypothetical protein